ncbi:MAG: membrane or secreted protein [Bacteroidetes bacterium]|jgi:hypothetical protein|nr:membrane or secreted protein [Bacteroidota bacterium]
MFWKLILISVILISIAIAGIAIKMFVKKGGEFKKSCGSVDPSTGKHISCSCGHSDGGADCDNKIRD